MHLIKGMKLRWVVLSFIFYRVSASVSTSDFRFSKKDFMANPICGLIFSVKRQCSLALKLRLFILAEHVSRLKKAGSLD